MKPAPVFILFMSTLLLPELAFSTDLDLEKLAKAGKLEVVNRTMDQTKADSPGVVFLNAAQGDGLAWIAGEEFSEGTIELETKGKNQPGLSFIGVAFHGQNNRIYDVIYLRPFNFQSSERGNHSIQYISLPDHDWLDLRNLHPGIYESSITPAPDGESWVKLKLVIRGGTVSAYVNGANQPALIVSLLNHRSGSKLGLWVGNGSDGWFRNLSITPAIN